jgi:hypothetical protein
MFKSQDSHFLSELLDKKGITEEEQRKIIITCAALNMIEVALATEGSNHKLAEEMENLDKYVAKIEAILK